MDMEVPDYYRYWGKSRKSNDTSGKPYHLLPYHCLDVAACGYIMVKENRYGIASVLADLNLKGEEAATWIGFLFACHDIGKFARGFQGLVKHIPPLVPPVGRVMYEIRHDTLGFWLWRQLFPDGSPDKIAIFPEETPEKLDRFIYVLDSWFKISTGHHGRPPENPGDRCALHFTPDDIIAAGNFVVALNKLFPFHKLPELWLEKSWRKKLKQQSWLLAGLITLADWVGSNEDYFSFESQPLPLQQYWQLACQRAQYALSLLPSPSITSSYSGPGTLFPFIKTLTPLQQCAETLDISDSGPQLIIFEDVTGAGKTEAAMILAHRLLSAEKGKGLYVGLPTMATANAMYQRLGEVYRVLFSKESRPSLVLAHGSSRMSAKFSDSLWSPGITKYRDYAEIDDSASRECHSWFADSRKKALLAEVGIGTVDQLLMAVMPFAHQSLRLLGMRDKILLLDEIHAYDGYMIRLLEGLLWFHAAQGGSAIILSATLPASLREKLLTAFSSGAGLSQPEPKPEAAYPWLTHLSSGGLHEQALETREEVRRCVAVDWLNTSERALTIIYQAVAAGECICWIRNTVDEALSIFRRLLSEGKIPPDNLLLFHSRFAFADRTAIEDKTLGWFGKNAPVGQRRGKVLIATQVVEQSLDIDMDRMISDLAPVDLLIQRAGRLQRHIRDRSGRCKSSLPDEREPPVLHILAPEWQEQAEPGWLGEELRGTGFVYSDHACLWRTQALLRQYGQIRMPEDARALVDGVYEAAFPAPGGLEKIEMKVQGDELSSRAIAKQNLLQRNKGYDRQSSDFAWDKERQFSTRLGEPGVDVYLAWLDSEGRLQPLAGEEDFPWERSRIQVRTSWWRQHGDKLCQPEEAQLAAFRKDNYRPEAQVLLVSENGEAEFYSRRFGLTGIIPARAAGNV